MPDLTKRIAFGGQDLGEYSWKDQVEVPALTPLPRLGPGQPRKVSIGLQARKVIRARMVVRSKETEPCHQFLQADSELKANPKLTLSS